MKCRNPWKQFPADSSGPLVTPSLLAADFARLGQHVDQVVNAGVQILHVDVMDGHFVPNLSMGPPVVASLRKYTDAALDVHLMVSRPEDFIVPFAEAGADSINFHIEVDADPVELTGQIRDMGLGTAITLKPDTPATAVESVIDMVDMVLVMTVYPGFGGQEFMDQVLPKIGTLRGMLSDTQRLQVDGGICPQTARLCRQAGADVFVAGSDIFRAADPAVAVEALNEAIV